MKFLVVEPSALPIFILLASKFVLFGCETWSHTLREERWLRIFANRILRRIKLIYKTKIIYIYFTSSSISLKWNWISAFIPVMPRPRLSPGYRISLSRLYGNGAITAIDVSHMLHIICSSNKIEDIFTKQGLPNVIFSYLPEYLISFLQYSLIIWFVLYLDSYETLKTFKYSLLTNQNSIQEEIKCRLKAGNSCYYSVQTRLLDF